MYSPLVVIESPYAGETPAEAERNIAYARAALADSPSRGKAPHASHLLFTQPGVLDDTNPDERRLGMEAGFAWGSAADFVAVYADLGISPGMKAGIQRAERRKQTLVRRSIPGWSK